MVALLCVYGLLVGCLATVQVAGLQEQHTVATRPPPPPPVASPALYFLLMNQQMNNVYNVSAVRAVFTRAAAAGYTGVVLYDHNLEALGSPWLRDDYLPSLHQVMGVAAQHGLEVIPQVYSFGHSEGMVFSDINLAEPTATSRLFRVSADRSKLEIVVSTPPLSNGNFTTHSSGPPNRVAGWDLQESPGLRTFIDLSVARAGSGGSVRIESTGGDSNMSKQARLMQTFPVVRRGTVTAECWIRGENLDLGQTGVDLRMQLNFDGMNNCARWEPASLKRACKATGGANCTFSWTRARVVCMDVGNHSSLELWVGDWANSTLSGRVWFTGCSLGSNGMGNILRRDGAPLIVKSGASTGTVYQEGIDFDPIPSTPQSAVNTSGDFPSDPVDVEVTLPPSTRMVAGEPIEIEYYFVPGGQVTACLTSSPSERYLVSSAQKHAEVFGQGSQYLVRYDELEQMHSCELCRARATTAGKLLAWHVNHSAEVLQANARPKRVMVWQDMFDPYANGNLTEYRGNTDGITGAWSGLPPSWVIANWNHQNTGYNATDNTCSIMGRCMTKSLRFFESLGFSQFMCGYYGSGNGTQSAIDGIAAAKGVNGLLGMIYGSWASGPVPGDPDLGGGDYSQLEEYAKAAQTYWPTLNKGQGTKEGAR